MCRTHEANVCPRVGQAVAGSRKGWRSCTAASILCEWKQSRHSWSCDKLPNLGDNTEPFIVLTNSMDQMLEECGTTELLERRQH